MQQWIYSIGQWKVYVLFKQYCSFTVQNGPTFYCTLCVLIDRLNAQQRTGGGRTKNVRANVDHYRFIFYCFNGQFYEISLVARTVSRFDCVDGRAAVMVFSEYKKQRILYFHAKGVKAPTIANLLHEEGLVCSRVGIAKFLRKFMHTGTFKRQPGSGRPSKIMRGIKKVVDDQMRLDDETTAVQFHRLLKEKGFNISQRTVLRCRSSHGWTFRGSAYCQHILESNKAEVGMGKCTSERQFQRCDMEQWE